MVVEKERGDRGPKNTKGEDDLKNFVIEVNKSIEVNAGHGGIKRLRVVKYV